MAQQDTQLLHTLGVTPAAHSAKQGSEVTQGSATGVLYSGIGGAWTLTINAATITEHQGATVTQGSASGRLSVALTGSGTTTVSIASTPGNTFVHSGADLVIGGAQWTLGIVAQAITESAGVTVTQGFVTGTLQTALSNEWTMAIASQEITEFARATVSQNEWTLAILNTPTINEISGGTVTQGSAVGTLKTTLSGATTSVVISTTSGVTFIDSVDLIIGNDEYTLGIDAQSITESAGALVTQGDSSGTLKTSLSNEWTMVIATQGITESSGASVVQGTSTGYLKTTLSNEWTLNIASQSINKLVGVTCTQGTSTGTLKIKLEGGTTTIVIETASGVVFNADDNVNVGGQVITGTGINTVTHSGASTSVVIVARSGVQFVDNVDITIGTTPVVLANIASATNNGVTTSVVIATAPGVVFVDSIIVLIGSTYLAFDDINTATKTKAAAVLVHANIDTASHTVSNTGTLKTKLTGATTSVIIKTAADVTFVPTSNIVIGTTHVLAANINTATNSGLTTNVVIATSADATFVTDADILIGSTTITTATAGTFTGNAFAAYNFASNADETLTVIVDGNDVPVVLSVNFGNVATAASKLAGAIVGATIAVDGSFLKITSASTGSASTITIKDDSGTNAKALFGVGASVTGLATNINTATQSGTVTTVNGADVTAAAMTATSVLSVTTALGVAFDAASAQNLVITDGSTVTTILAADLLDHGTPVFTASASKVSLTPTLILDMAQTTNVFTVLTLTEFADIEEPRLETATIDFSTGVIDLKFSETIDTEPLSLVSLNKVFITNAADGEDINLESFTGGYLGGSGIATFPLGPQQDTSVRIQLSEAQRVAGILLSNTPGGDGTPILFHVDEVDAFRDIATNSLRPELVDAFVMIEHPDAIRPSIDAGAVFLNLSDGTIRLTVSETIDCTSIDYDGVDQVFNLTRLSLSQASGDYTESIARLGGTIFDNTLVIPLRDSQSTVSPLGRLFPTIEFTLSEDDRIFAIERSANALKGGDGTGLVLDALSGAFRDIGQNPSLAVEGVTVQETVDTVPIRLLSASIDLTTGVVTVVASEYFHKTLNLVKHNLLNFFLSDEVDNTEATEIISASPQVAATLICLTGGSELTSVLKNVLTFTLSENQRSAAIAKSGTPGGNGGATSLVINSQGTTDVANNLNDRPQALTLTETSDIQAPNATSAVLDFSTGTLIVTFDENVDLSTLANNIDLDLGRISQVPNGTMTVNKWTVTVSGQGMGVGHSKHVTVTQTSASTLTGSSFTAHDFTSDNQNLIVVVDGGSSQTITVASNCNTATNCATALSASITGASVSSVSKTCTVKKGGTNAGCAAANADSATCSAADIVNTCTVTGSGTNNDCAAANVGYTSCAAATASGGGLVPSTCTPASTNGACSSVSAPADQAACDPQTVAATAGTFTGNAFAAYNFASNADETLTVIVDGADVEITLNAAIADVAAAASGITIAGATIAVDGSFLKITSASTGSTSTITIKADSGTNAKALFGVGASVTGVATNACTYAAPSGNVANDCIFVNNNIHDCLFVGDHLVVASATTGTTSSVSITTAGSGVNALSLFGTAPTFKSGFNTGILGNDLDGIMTEVIIYAQRDQHFDALTNLDVNNGAKIITFNTIENLATSLEASIDYPDQVVFLNTLTDANFEDGSVIHHTLLERSSENDGLTFTLKLSEKQRIAALRIR